MNIEYAKNLLSEGDVESARAHLIELALQEPELPQAWLLLSGIATKQKDWALGQKAFSELIKGCVCFFRLINVPISAFNVQRSIR